MMNDDERDNEFEPNISLWWLVWLFYPLLVLSALFIIRRKQTTHSNKAIR